MNNTTILQKNNYKTLLIILIFSIVILPSALADAVYSPTSNYTSQMFIAIFVPFILIIIIIIATRLIIGGIIEAIKNNK